jgi:hypothetical protein
MTTQPTKTTTRQRAWLRHLARTGDTKAIPANTWHVLLREGLVEHKLGAIYVLTDAGRQAITR